MMHKILIILSIFAVCAFALDDLNFSTTYVDSGVIEASDFEDDKDSTSTWTSRTNDSLEAKFVRFSDLTSGDSTISRLQVDTLIVNGAGTVDVDTVVGDVIQGDRADIDTVYADTLGATNSKITTMYGSNISVDSIYVAKCSTGYVSTDTVICSGISADSISFGNAYMDTYVYDSIQVYVNTNYFVAADTAWMHYNVVGNQVSISFGILTGTSNSTSLFVLPVGGTWPSVLGFSSVTESAIGPILADDDGFTLFGFSIIKLAESSTDSLEFVACPGGDCPASAGWTGSGTKGIQNSNTSYMIRN